MRYLGPIEEDNNVFNLLLGNEFETNEKIENLDKIRKQTEDQEDSNEFTLSEKVCPHLTERDISTHHFSFSKFGVCFRRYHDVFEAGKLCRID